MRIVLVLLLFLGAGSKYLERDLGKVTAQYLAIAPPAFCDALDPLLDHRARTLTVAVVRTDDIARQVGPGPEGVATLIRRVGPKFALLVGDAKAVPTFIRKSAYVSDRFACACNCQ